METLGHDVLALASDQHLGALDDPEALALAAEQERILVTRNGRDFAPLLRQWAEADKHHSGCILIWSLSHSQFAAIVDGIAALLAGRPTPELWSDLTVAL